ncbi:MAG: ATP-binding cassette domain-containing protein [Prevotella sp.]|nr:ATP-binding cassette domain-containing protein [Prevotella sp.]
MLELKDATLTVGGRQLFSKLSLMAQDGQLTCITGESGAGKTAMIRVMLGFQALDEGLVSIDGELLTPLSAPTFRRMMAYVPQKREVKLQPMVPDTEGLETVWSPYSGRRYQLTPIDEHLDVPPMGSKQIVIADDPDYSMLGTLKALANGGHTVIVASQREEFLHISDKVIRLGNHDAILS